MAFALLVPETSEAGGGTKFPGLRLLVVSDVKGVMEAGFGFRGNCLKIVAGGAFESIQFWLRTTVLRFCPRALALP